MSVEEISMISHVLIFLIIWNIKIQNLEQYWDICSRRNDIGLTAVLFIYFFINLKGENLRYIFLTSFHLLKNKSGEHRWKMWTSCKLFIFFLSN